jgi:filamentous hemagglutinin
MPPQLPSSPPADSTENPLFRPSEISSVAGPFRLQRKRDVSSYVVGASGGYAALTAPTSPSILTLGESWDTSFSNIGSTGGAADSVPLRVSNGVSLNPNLPDPVAGLDYVPNTLDSQNPNIANSHINGYTSELNLANSVADIPGETVVQYGDVIGAHGADIVSVADEGSVTLWGAKFRSSSSDPGVSPTFTPGSTAFESAIQDATDAIINSTNLNDAARDAALTNLANRTFTTVTAGQGQATTSTVINFVKGKVQ